MSDNQNNSSFQRYFAYTNRLAKIRKYIIYTSDLGQSFRPISSHLFVSICHTISVIYILYQCHQIARNKVKYKYNSYWQAWGKQFIFHGIASIILPAVIINTLVKQTGELLNKKKYFNQMKRRCIAVFVGMSIIPILPYILDNPVQILINNIVNKLITEKKI